MAYYDEQLQSLLEQTTRKKRLDTMLAELYVQQEALSERVRELDAIRLDEQADVGRLEGGSLASFFYNVIGRMDKKLDKERAEARAAQVKYDAAAHELAAVTKDIEHTEAELSQLFGCEERYEETLNAKAREIKASGTGGAEEILKAEANIAFYGSQKKEIREALAAGQKALDTANDIIPSLDSAEGWGTWDLLGGGLISDLAKHGHLDEAQARVERLQGELRRFKTELADVTVSADLRIGIDGFLRFADYFFDGIFADWAVLDRISESQERMRATKGQIESALNRLRVMELGADKKLQTEREQLRELITRTHF